MNIDDFETLDLGLIAARLVALHARTSSMSDWDRNRLLEKAISDAIITVYRRGRRDQMNTIKGIVDRWGNE